MEAKRYGPYVHRTQGYVFFIEYDPKTKTHRTIREHREVMERVLGRSLEGQEEVHHRDGVRSNNAIENLEVMTKNKHVAAHIADGVLAGTRGNVEIQCSVCGKFFLRHVTAERKRIRRGGFGPFCSRRCVGMGTQKMLGMKRKINADRRFWEKVERGADGECWVWLGATSSRDGAGVVQRDGKRVFAHRVAWELLKGNLQPGNQLRRTCKNKLCVNPEHMTLSSTSLIHG